VAGHTGLSRRQGGEGGVLNAGVAVTAVDAIVTAVVLVTERHRLVNRKPLPRGV